MLRSAHNPIAESGRLTWIFKPPSSVLEMNDWHRVAHDSTAERVTVRRSSVTAFNVFRVLRVEVNVEPVVVVEVAMGVRGERASKVLAKVVHVARGIVDPQSRFW